jgi:hypothetical protein
VAEGFPVFALMEAGKGLKITVGEWFGMGISHPHVSLQCGAYTGCHGRLLSGAYRDNLL